MYLNWVRKSKSFIILSFERGVKLRVEYSGCIERIVCINDCLIFVLVLAMIWLSSTIEGEGSVIASLIICAMSN